MTTLAREIAPQLPYLRRFARALSGSQQGGDAYVVATLEALIADQSAFPRHLPVRQALYSVFLKLWSVTATTAPVADSAGAVERNLEALTPLPRQTFLLRTVEGFSVEEVAAILGLTPQKTVALID